MMLTIHIGTQHKHNGIISDFTGQHFQSPFVLSGLYFQIPFERLRSTHVSYCISRCWKVLAVKSMSPCSWRFRKNNAPKTQMLHCSANSTIQVKKKQCFLKNVNREDAAARCFPVFFSPFIQTHLFDVFALKSTDETDRTWVDCSDLASAARDLFIVLLHWNLRHKITDTVEKGVAKNPSCSQSAVYFEFHKWRRLKGAFEEVFNVPLNTKNRTVHCWGGQIEIAAGNKQL